MKNKILLTAGILLALTSCKQKQDNSVNKFDDPLILNMDTTVSPGEDFFRYATGNWMKKNPIPPAERTWGIWSLVQDETYQRMQSLSVDASMQQAEEGTATKMIGDFYHSGMDTVAIEKNGITPLKPFFDEINSISDVNSVLKVISKLQTYGVAPLFNVYIFQDEMRSDVVALHLYQGGIGLPNRDYYTNDDERNRSIRGNYKEHLYNIFRLAGDDSITASKNRDYVFDIETSLAKSSRKLAELRDPYRNYNKMQLSDMRELTPVADWNSILTDMHIRNIDSVIVGQPEFFMQVEKELRQRKPESWKAYLRWHLIHSYASELNKAFEDEHFRFYGTVLGGVKEMRPRWKRVLDNEEGAMGDLLGQLYVEKYVPPSVKKRYQDLTDNIIQAYRERIQQLTWMTDSTKQKALVKLNSIKTKVGYPDKWKDYSALKITRDSYVMNVMRSNEWHHNYEVAKLGKPVDRTEWDMTPQTYNAYYNPSNNEIVLPAAIFIIPGLPDTLADDAIIYGYAGASTIGHELTHGFDDEGRQYDANGNLQNWWTESDEKEFSKRAELIVKQFNDFIVLDSMHVNGEATQGENIADLGGVVLGYHAFQKTEQYKSGKTINGLTPDQRYFLGYAIAWLGHMRDETLAMRIMTDVHAPNDLRVNGPVANLPEFYKAFNIKEGDKMWRPDSLRVNIW